MSKFVFSASNHTLRNFYNATFIRPKKTIIPKIQKNWKKEAFRKISNDLYVSCTKSAYSRQICEYVSLVTVELILSLSKTVAKRLKGACQLKRFTLKIFRAKNERGNFSLGAMYVYTPSHDSPIPFSIKSVDRRRASFAFRFQLDATDTQSHCVTVIDSRSFVGKRWEKRLPTWKVTWK